MPEYKYRCQNCQHIFEIEQRITEKPLKKCPNCSTPALKRVIGAVGIAFNSSGFYITDSRKNIKKSKSKTELIKSTKKSIPKK